MTEGLRAAARPAVVLLAMVLASCTPSPEYDVILRGGTVVDGTGLRRFEGDVGIRGGYVVAVGDLSDSGALDDVDVAGLFVTPGFINLHSHNRLDAASTAENLLTQGVTTIVLNADGGGSFDVQALLDRQYEAGFAVHVAPNVGFNTAWGDVVGPRDIRPTAEQKAAVRDAMEAGLADGAWGVSAGLDYKPTYFATTEEVVEILSGLERWRTVFTNHDRLMPEHGFSSMVGMRETIDIGAATGLMPIITHMKIQGHEQGSHEAVLGMMSTSTESGVYVAADVYPYLAGATSLAALIIPGWAQEGGVDAMRARFGDPEQRARIVAEANEAMAARFGGPEGVFVRDEELGRELTDLMAEMEVTDGGEAVVRILEEDTPGTILRFGAEEDLRAILRHPTASIACDCDPSDGRPGHPRTWGTFPRVLGRYVRELGVLTWEDAVRKMTGLPAATIGFTGTGLVAPGMAADLAVFDPEAILDRATFDEPTLVSEGMRHVLVGGRFALRDGAATGVAAGGVLTRNRWEPARPQSTGTRRRVELDATVESFQGVSAVHRVEIELSQAPGERSATGFVRVTDEAGMTLRSTRLGVLQATDGWAGITGTLAPEGDDDARSETAFHLVVDTADPTGVGPTAVAFVAIDGPQLAGWTDAAPEIESMPPEAR